MSRRPQARVDYWAEAVRLLQAVLLAGVVIGALWVGSPWVVAVARGMR